MSYTKTTNFAIKDTYLTGNPAKVIKGVEIDAEFDNIATADAANLKRDGSVAASANIPMGGFKLTGLANGVASSDAATVAQVDALIPLANDYVTNQSQNSGTTGGTSTAYTLTPATALTSYAANKTFWVTFHVASGAAPTLQISGVATPPNLVRQNSAGAYVNIAAGEIPIDHRSRVTLISASQALIEDMPPPIFSANQMQGISASVASNALTISAGTLALDFRSTTLGSGTVTTVSGTPANLVISSGSTLGTANAISARLVVIALNNAGTIELAVVNLAGGNQLDETNLINTTAEGGAGAADSANVIYSTTARTSVAYRVIGFIDITEATAGTWATAPSTIQGIGGQALTALSSLGYGQTWQDVTGSRTSGTTYTNSTGKPIVFNVTGAAGALSSGVTLVVAGVTVCSWSSSDPVNGSTIGASAVVPSGATYSATTVGALSRWTELR